MVTDNDRYEKELELWNKSQVHSEKQSKEWAYHEMKISEIEISYAKAKTIEHERHLRIMREIN